MKVEVNVPNKVFYLLAGILAVLGISGIVIATWDTSKNVFHSADDVKVKISEVDYSLQEAIDGGKFGGSGSLFCFDVFHTSCTKVDGICDPSLSVEYTIANNGKIKHILTGKTGQTVCNEVYSGSLCVDTDDYAQNGGAFRLTCVSKIVVGSEVDDFVRCCKIV